MRKRILFAIVISLFLSVLIIKLSLTANEKSKEKLEENEQFAPNIVSNKNEYYHVDIPNNKNVNNENNGENDENLNENEEENYFAEYIKEEEEYEQENQGKRELNYCWEKQEEESTEKLCIPKHYIIGVSKCGTTFLQNVLSTHPKVSKQLKKDLNFYNYDFRQGLEFYANQFFSSFDHLRLDNSPAYFVDMRVPPLVWKTVPHAKLLVILRNPVERALSNYYSFLRNPNIFNSSPQYNHCFFERRPFEMYLQEELELLQRCNFFDEEWNPPSPPWNQTSFERFPEFDNCQLFPCNTCEECFPEGEPVISILNSAGMLMKSLYYPSLQIYSNYFPRENFNIIRLEDFKEIGNEEMFNRICDWMGIDQLEWAEYTDFHYDHDEYPPMQNSTREWLEEFYRVPIQRLNSITHSNFSWY